MSALSLLRDALLALPRIASGIERLAALLEKLSPSSEVALWTAYEDYQEDGSAAPWKSQEELAAEEWRRAKWEELSGKRLPPWEHPPEDFAPLPDRES